MKLFKRGMSIRWKLVLAYFLLVFVATTIIGAFILSQTEEYYINSERLNMTNVAQEGTLISTLSTYENLYDNADEIQSNVDAWVKSIQLDIFVVDESFDIIASNTANVGKSAIDVLDRTVVLKGLSGEFAETAGEITQQETGIPVMNMAFPIENGGEITGVLYLRADMSSIYDSINQSKVIFVKAMLIALVVTVILGFLISGSITGPIKELTEKAQKMSKGDYSGEIVGRSDDEIGKLAEVLNFLRTEQNRSISEIAAEKTKLETILRYMADGLVAMDLSGRIIHANPAVAEILKTKTENLQNASFDDVMKALKSDMNFESLKEKSGEGPGAETFTNGVFTYAIRYTKFKNDSDEDAGIIMIIQDITERQKLENMQTDFVANVSHELKTPLTTIKSYTETLLDGALEDPETARSFLSIVDTEADRMNRLVKELLQLSRLDYKQEKWHKYEADLVPLLKNAVTKMSMTANQKGQHVNCLFNPDERIAVIMDKDGMEQVVLNILSNSIKYTKEGGRIDVDAYMEDKRAKITITDNGIGIPENEVSRVFERFFRVDKARSRAMGGTGLGLAITKQIVEEHNGSISLESREGKGTKVTITLPLAVQRGQKGIE